MSQYATWRGSDNYRTTITASGTPHVKGSYTQLAASTSWDASLLYLVDTGGNGTHNYLLDLATGAVASEVVVVANIMIQVPFIGSDVGGWGIMPFDVDIPISTRLSARVQSSTASQILTIYLVQQDRALGLANGPATYGVNTGTTRGTSVDPGGVADTKGAYTEVTASTANDHDVLDLILGTQGNIFPTSADWRYDIATGAAASEVVVVPDIGIRLSTVSSTQPAYPSFGRFELVIPSGTRLSVRTQCSITDATDRLLDFSLIGMNSIAGGGGETSHVF